jgi:elongation factor P
VAEMNKFAILKKHNMPSPKDLGSGSVVKFNGELCTVVDIIHRTPGNLRAFYQAKLRNIKSGKLIEYRYRADENVDIARVEKRQLQYIYPEGDSLVCMDNTTYEQIYVPSEMFGDAVKFLKENMEVWVAFESDSPIYAEAPPFVELEITYTEPGLKGDTATNTLKPAKVETGASVNVPLFINEGERIRIDTRTGDYVERAKG